MRASLTDLSKLREEGYQVGRAPDAFGKPTNDGWTLKHDGDLLMIGEHGCISPTQWEAVAEGLRRIAQDKKWS